MLWASGTGEASPRGPEPTSPVFPSPESAVASPADLPLTEEQDQQGAREGTAQEEGYVERVTSLESLDNLDGLFLDPAGDRLGPIPYGPSSSAEPAAPEPDRATTYDQASSQFFRPEKMVVDPLVDKTGSLSARDLSAVVDGYWLPMGPPDVLNTDTTKDPDSRGNAIPARAPMQEKGGDERQSDATSSGYLLALPGIPWLRLPSRNLVLSAQSEPHFSVAGAMLGEPLPRCNAQVKQHRGRRLFLAKALTQTPELISEEDCRSPDTLFHIQACSYPGAVPVPRHWRLRKGNYLAEQPPKLSQAGLERFPLHLPAVLEATAIPAYRAAKWAWMRSGGTTGKLPDIPHQNRQQVTLRDLRARIESQTPLYRLELLEPGELDYEGRKGDLVGYWPDGYVSPALREALGLRPGQAPLPW